jgi:hypothetical protein
MIEAFLEERRVEQAGAGVAARFVVPAPLRAEAANGERDHRGDRLGEVEFLGVERFAVDAPDPEDAAHPLAHRQRQQHRREGGLRLGEGQRDVAIDDRAVRDDQRATLLDRLQQPAIEHLQRERWDVGAAPTGHGQQGHERARALIEQRDAAGIGLQQLLHERAATVQRILHIVAH